MRAHTQKPDRSLETQRSVRRVNGGGMDSAVVRCLVSSSISFVFTGEFSPNFDLKKYDFDLYRRAGFLLWIL
jgi:hypothetical protein